MATPLRKDEPQFEEPLNNEPLDRDEEITTADLAQGKRPASDTRGLQAVTSDRGMATNAASLNASGTDASQEYGLGDAVVPEQRVGKLTHALEGSSDGVCG